MPLDDLRLHGPTWQEGEDIRAWSMRFERGDLSVWDAFVERLATRYRFAPEIRDVLIDAGIVYRNLDTEALEFAMPSHVEEMPEELRTKVLYLLDQEFPSVGKSNNDVEIEKPLPKRGKGEIMYVESKSDSTGEARIGRVFFSQTRKTLYYLDLVLRSLKGSGVRGNYADASSGGEYWVSKCKKRGNDTLFSGTVHIDDDVREEYWTEIRGQPENRHVTAFRSAGKHGR